MLNPQLNIKSDDETRVLNLGFTKNISPDDVFGDGYEYKNKNFRVLIDFSGVVTMSRRNPDTDPIVLFVPQVSDLEHAIGQLVD